MNSDKKAARFAGFLYLLVIVFGVFAELYIRFKLIIPNNAGETVQNIMENQDLLRLGFISDLMMQVAFFFLPLALYQLFKKVNKSPAILMVFSVMVSVAIMCLNILRQYVAILILENGKLMAYVSLWRIYYPKVIGKEKAKLLSLA